MRYLLCVVDDGQGLATGEQMEAIGAFNDRLRADGRLLLADGLAGPGESVLVDGRSDPPSVHEGGSVSDPAHAVTGLWLLDVPDGDTALALAVDGSRACGRRVELRPVLAPPA